jgi:tetratricopeptide (TPR) repeat protein
VVYEGLLLVQRRQLHTTVGEMLEQLFPGEIERLAYHFSRSNDLDKGIYYLDIAARKASREYANQAAIEYYSQILQCLMTKPAPRNSSDERQQPPSTGNLRSRFLSTEYWDTLLKRAKLYNLVGWRDEELEDLGTLGILAEALNDDRRRALAAKEWANFYEKTADYDSGLELIERATQLAQSATDEQLTGETFNKWGRLLYLRGDYHTARNYLEQAFEIAQKYEDQLAQADSLDTQGIIAYYQTDYQASHRLLEKAIVLWQNLGEQIGLSNSLRHLGRVQVRLGEYLAARQCYNQALLIHRTIGDWTGEAQTKHYLGEVEHTLGNFPIAKNHLEEAIMMYQTVNDHLGYAYCLSQLGFLFHRLADQETALNLLEKALGILRELDDLRGLASTLTYYSWVLIAADRIPKARSYLQEALQIERDIKNGIDEAAIAENIVLLGRAALIRNDLSLAETCARHAYTFVQNHAIYGIKYPAMVFLTCYEIFQANKQHAQAEHILKMGEDYLLNQASQFTDPLARQSYLTKIQENFQLYSLIQNYQTLNTPHIQSGKIIP